MIVHRAKVLLRLAGWMAALLLPYVSCHAASRQAPSAGYIADPHQAGHGGREQDSPVLMRISGELAELEPQLQRVTYALMSAAGSVSAANARDLYGKGAALAQQVATIPASGCAVSVRNEIVAAAQGVDMIALHVIQQGALRREQTVAVNGVVTSMKDALRDCRNRIANQRKLERQGPGPR